MSFFPPRPEPEPEPVRTPYQYASWPGQQPENYVPGVVAWSLPLAATNDTSVTVVGAEVYPEGVAFSLEVRFRPGTEEDHLDPGGLRMYLSTVEGLRFGLQLADGSKAFSDERPPNRGSPGSESSLPESQAPRWHLASAGGGGGGLTYDQHFWLWPLPGDGRIEFVCEWGARGVGESRAAVETEELVRAAARAVELWPLPPPQDPGEEDGAGWFSYGPR